MRGTLLSQQGTVAEPHFALQDHQHFLYVNAQQEQWRLYQEQQWRLYQEWRIDQERKVQEQWRFEQEWNEQEWRIEQEKREWEWWIEQGRKEWELWKEQEVKEESCRIEQGRIQHQEHARLQGTWKRANGETIAEKAVHNTVDCTDDECPICFDLTDADSRYLMPCAHWACVPCMREYLRIKKACPICCMTIE